MAYEYKLTQRVEFSHTDMAGIVHFTNFFRYMESTEHAFYRSLGFSVHGEHDSQTIGFPRVQASCHFSAPLCFEDRVETHLLVREIKAKSIAYDFVFRKLDGERSEEVARGQLTIVCVVNPRPSGPMRAVAIPQTIRQQLEVAPAELLQA